MNGLVAYGSSDDEEDEQIENATHAVQNQNTAVTKETKDVLVTSINAQAPAAPSSDAPLMGPAVPKHYDHDLGGYDEPRELPDMSERDSLRYLTPASHPMTEMPPSPPGTPDASVSAKVRRFLDLKPKGAHFNADLAGKQAFKNPGLLQAMMDRIGMDSQSQYRTSLPEMVLDVDSFPATAYKEGLLQSQQEIRTIREAENRKMAAAGNRTIDFGSRGTLQM